MLMAATRMVDSSSAASPPPWLPVPGDHHHHHQLLHDFTAPAPSPVPSHHHLLPRAAAPAAAHRRVATKRRPRPSRRLPTTYISADPASFRRMVHQVTGAHDLLLAPLPQQPPPAEVLCRPAPNRSGDATCHGAPNTLLLPTLDTSAFLIGAAGALARAGTGRPSDGSAAGLPAAPVPTLTAEADNNNSARSSSSSSCGLLFPFSTLESWDHHHATLF